MYGRHPYTDRYIAALYSVKTGVKNDSGVENGSNGSTGGEWPGGQKSTPVQKFPGNENCVCSQIVL